MRSLGFLSFESSMGIPKLRAIGEAATVADGHAINRMEFNFYINHILMNVLHVVNEGKPHPGFSVGGPLGYSGRLLVSGNPYQDISDEGPGFLRFS